MNFSKLSCVVSLVAFAAVSASAQSLPELAKAEKERRAKLRAQGGAAKVYTESDRNSGTTVPATEVTIPATTTGAPDPAGAASNKKKEKTAEELAAEKQKEWNDRLKAAQDEVKQVEDEIARNERNLSAMINITPARADLANRIEADKKKLAGLKQTLLNLEDERRRAGMPRPR
jgi:hypothetical protein